MIYSKGFLLQLQYHSQQVAIIDKLLEELQRKHQPNPTDTLHNNKKNVTKWGNKKVGLKARLKQG